MTKRWVTEHRNDPYYKKAKVEGYRSRASFKLSQMNKRYGLLRKGFSVVDLGCSPGGWLQVAIGIVGYRGSVIGVDLANTKAIKGAIFIRGDMRREETASQVMAKLPGGKAHVVISDMSPNISGNYSIDHARSIELAETAFEFASKVLRSEGNFLVKVFQGDMFNNLLKRVKKDFEFCKAHSPKASRKASSEIYIVAKGFIP